MDEQIDTYHETIRQERADALRATLNMTGVMPPVGQGIEVSRYRDGIAHG